MPARDDDVAGERQPVYSTRALAKAIMPRYKGSLKRGRVGLLRQQARAAGATNGEEEVAATADDPVSALTQLIASCEQDFAQSEKFQALSKKQKRKAEGAAEDPLLTASLSRRRPSCAATLRHAVDYVGNSICDYVCGMRVNMPAVSCTATAACA